MKFLCFADLHLGAGASLGREPGSRLYDQDAVLKHILACAAEHEVDAILNAGDTFEGPLVTPEQLAVFADFVAAVERRGIPIIAISGNGKHDSAMRPVNGIGIFEHVQGITAYSWPGLYDLGPVQVAALPWTSPARLIARYGATIDRDKTNEQAASLTVRAAAQLCDPTIKPTVLLMHGSISGASLPAGISTDELREPVVQLDELLEVGYAAVVAGHIHVPQACGYDVGWIQPAASGDEWATVSVLYTGSPMPLNFGETGVPHGCWLLDVNDGVAGAEFIPIESRPLLQTSLDLATVDEGGSLDALELFESVLDPGSWPGVVEAIAKITLRCTKTQQRRLDVGRLRTAVLDAGAHTVKIEVETVREDRARVESVTDELEPLEAFDAWAAAGSGSGDAGLLAAARERMEADLAEVAA